MINIINVICLIFKFILYYIFYGLNFLNITDEQHLALREELIDLYKQIESNKYIYGFIKYF